MEGANVTDDRLQQMIDAHEIEGIFLRYFRGIDLGSPEDAVREFAQDARAEIMTGKDYVGRDRIARALGRVRVRYERTSHHLTNFLVDLDGDRAVATGYVYAFHRMKDTMEPWHLWARIRDELVRVGDRWVVTVHQLRGVDSVPGREDIPRAWYNHPVEIAREQELLGDATMFRTPV